jgi:hypothetical protein
LRSGCSDAATPPGCGSDTGPCSVGVGWAGGWGVGGPGGWRGAGGSPNIRDGCLSKHSSVPQGGGMNSGCPLAAEERRAPSAAPRRPQLSPPAGPRPGLSNAAAAAGPDRRGVGLSLQRPHSDSRSGGRRGRGVAPSGRTSDSAADSEVLENRRRAGQGRCGGARRTTERRGACGAPARRPCAAESRANGRRAGSREPFLLRGSKEWGTPAGGRRDTTRPHGRPAWRPPPSQARDSDARASERCRRLGHLVQGTRNLGPADRPGLVAPARSRAPRCGFVVMAAARPICRRGRVPPQAAVCRLRCHAARSLWRRGEAALGLRLRVLRGSPPRLLVAQAERCRVDFGAGAGRSDRARRLTSRLASRHPLQAGSEPDSGKRLGSRVLADSEVRASIRGDSAP